MRAALSGRTVPLYGTGAQRRDFTYVSDVVSATIAAATAPAGGGEVVNVGSGSGVPLADVIGEVTRFAGVPVPVLHRGAQPGDVDATTADLARAQDLLGYRPQVGLGEGLRRQWEWLAALEPAAVPARA